MENSWHETESNDSGSLKTGKIRLAIGDQIQIEGEPKPRPVTHVMGSDRKGWFATFKGYGTVPQGVIKWRIVHRAGADMRIEDFSQTNEGSTESQQKRAMAEESENVRIAKITARQAITVAIITAITGILLGIASGYQTGKSHQPGATQHWITLKSVAAEPFNSGSAARLVVLVNSQAYSYPSRAVWADIDPKMSRESFPLPINADEFRIRFEVFYRAPNGSTVLYSSQETHEIRVSDVKSSVERTYTTFPLDQTFTRGIHIDQTFTRGIHSLDQVTPQLTVVYEIR